MKNQELYHKYKISRTPTGGAIFTKKSWPFDLFITVVAVLFEPLLMYRHYTRVPLTLAFYLTQVQYFLLFCAPFGAFLFWANWRESTKRNKGYGWVGRFEVTSKRSSFAFCYLLLTPGVDNELRVDRTLFQKTNVGDRLQIRRDAFGGIEEIKRVQDFAARLTRTRARPLLKHH